MEKGELFLLPESRKEKRKVPSTIPGEKRKSQRKERRRASL